MKFTVPFDQFAEAVTMVNSNPTPSCLKDVVYHVLFETDKDAGTVSLTKTDHELTIKTTVKANVEEPGRATFLAENLAKLLNTYKKLKKNHDCNVEVQAQNNRVSIRFTDNDKYKPLVLAGLDPDLFPVCDEFEDQVASCEVVSDLLKDYFDKALIALNKDEKEPEHRGAYFKYKGADIELVSTNRSEIALIEATPLDVSFEGGLQEAFALVSRKTLEAASKVIKGPLSTHVSISIDQVLLHGERDGVKFELLNGTLDVQDALEARSALPQSIETSLSIPSVELKNALSHIEAIVDKSLGNRVKICVDPKNSETVILSCKTALGEIPGIPVPAEIHKTPAKSQSLLILSDKRLAALLKAIRSKDVLISYKATGEACTFKGTSEPHFTLIAGSLEAKPDDKVTAWASTQPTPAAAKAPEAPKPQAKIEPTVPDEKELPGEPKSFEDLSNFEVPTAATAAAATAATAAEASGDDDWGLGDIDV